MSPSLSRRAFTLVEIMVVVLIVVILSTLAIAAIGKVKALATESTTRNNLRQIYQAKEFYFTENPQETGVLATELRAEGYISEHTWVACFESPVIHGMTYQGSFKPGTSVWAGPAVVGKDGSISVSEFIKFPAP